MSESGPLQKAEISEVGGSKTVKCAFNPTEYSISKSAKWEQQEQPAARSAPKATFGGTRARRLTMQLFFDAWGSGNGIGGDIDQLLSWTNPTESSLSKGEPAPPYLNFKWGDNQFFTSFLDSATASYKLFDPDGTPLRATVDVTFVEVPTTDQKQNPTSGGPAGNRSALVTEDAGLAAIAFREYGQAALWRGLAAANGIDDPFRVPVGSTVLIPPRTEVEALS